MYLINKERGHVAGDPEVPYCTRVLIRQNLWHLAVFMAVKGDGVKENPVMLGLFLLQADQPTNHQSVSLFWPLPRDGWRASIVLYLWN